MKFYKKGLQQGAVFVVIVLLLIAGMAFFLGKSQTPSKLSVTSSGGGVASPSTPTSRINLVDKTTVTFSSWDIRNKATNAGTAHLLLIWKDASGGQKGVGNIYADDATATMSPDDSYQVLVGNLTLASTITAGTNYYPTYLTGSVPDSGTHSVSAGQYLTAGASQITFAFFDINDQVQTSATGQAIGTSDDKVVKWKVTPNADTCVGNPDTGGQNTVTYLYNGSVFTTVDQYTVGSTNVDSSTSTPRGAQATFAGIPDVYLKSSFNFPVVCGPASVDKQVRLKTGSTNNPGQEDNVSVVFSDVSWGYNTKTFELIKGYVNDQNADLGVTDFVAGALLVS